MKRTWTIGLIATEIDNPVRSRLIEALRLQAQARGFQLLVGGIGSRQDMTILKNMPAQRLEGLILGNVGHEFVEQLKKEDLPVVSFGQETGLAWDNISIDYGGMIEKLTRHLIDRHGLRRIVFAGLPTNYSRRLNYEKAMTDSGLAPEKELWTMPEWSLAAGRRLAEKQIAAGSRPEGIVCHNDLLAIGVIAGLRNCGLRVPEDVAVVGMDNIEMADYCNPTLTTAGVQSCKLAEDLFALLYERIEGKEPPPAPREIVYPGEVFFRESCGCGCNPENIPN
jgi:LacI family transcriptional regulator